jgi:hypothetical protein
LPLRTQRRFAASNRTFGAFADAHGLGGSMKSRHFPAGVLAAIAMFAATVAMHEVSRSDGLAAGLTAWPTFAAGAGR